MDNQDYRKEYKEPKRKVFFKDEGNFNSHQISTWVFGIFLILIGGALVIEMNTNIDLPILDNWWAFFIILPGIQLLISGWGRFREDGEFFAMFPGALVFFLGLSFFIGVSITWVWALFLIFLGFSLILKK